jgi:hypothetical protein
MHFISKTRLLNAAPVVDHCTEPWRTNASATTPATQMRSIIHIQSWKIARFTTGLKGSVHQLSGNASRAIAVHASSSTCGGKSSRQTGHMVASADIRLLRSRSMRCSLSRHAAKALRWHQNRSSFF